MLALLVAVTIATCPPSGWTAARLDVLRKDGFKIPDISQRQELAVALTACLGDPDPNVRDAIAFEALSSWLRGGQLDLATMKTLRADLLEAIARTDAEGFGASFSALVLSEVARTDRMQAWMSGGEREDLVRAAAMFLARVKDYRAFSNAEGFRHAVAHGADLVLQLALNPLTTKAQLDHMMLAVATQVAPDGTVAYWAGEPDRRAAHFVHRATPAALRRRMAAVFQRGDESASAGVVACGVLLRSRHQEAPQCPRVSPQCVCQRHW